MEKQENVDQNAATRIVNNNSVNNKEMINKTKTEIEIPPPIVARVNSPPPPEEEQLPSTKTNKVEKLVVEKTVTKEEVKNVIVDIINEIVDEHNMTVTNTVTTNVVNTDDDNNKVEKVPETSVNNDAILPTTSNNIADIDNPMDNSNSKTENSETLPLKSVPPVQTKVESDATTTTTDKIVTKNITSQFIFRMGEIPVILRKYLLSLGWKEWSGDYNRENEWNFRWKSGRYRPTEYKTPEEFQRMNHFPKSSIMTKKDTMLRALRKSKAIHGNVYAFFPDSFILPTEYTKFVHRFAEQEKPELWICKPDGSSRGRGIFLIKDLSELHYDQQYIVQRYIERPLCVGGYKMDLRVYVLVRSFKPLKAFIYRDGLARFGTEKYNEDPNGDIKNLYSHLTNASINKFSKTFWKDKDVIGAGCKWTFVQLREWFETTGRDWELMWARLRNVISLTLLTAVKAVPRKPWCFELFGFDIMLDEALKPWLIEVNCSPALGTTEKADYAVKEPLLKDMMHLLEMKPVDFSKRNNNNKRSSSIGTGKGSSNNRSSSNKMNLKTKNSRSSGKNARERIIKNRSRSKSSNNTRRNSSKIQVQNNSKENIPHLTEEELNLKLKSYHVPETNYEKLFPFDQPSEDLAFKMDRCDDDMGIANVQRDIVRLLRMEQKILKLRQKKVDAGNNKGGGKNNDNIVKVDTSATVNANVSIVQNKIKIAKEMDSTLNG